jgi:hypothetical protein
LWYFYLFIMKILNYFIIYFFRVNQVHSHRIKILPQDEIVKTTGNNNLALRYHFILVKIVLNISATSLYQTYSLKFHLLYSLKWNRYFRISEKKNIFFCLLQLIRHFFVILSFTYNTADKRGFIIEKQLPRWITKYSKCF